MKFVISNIFFVLIIASLTGYLTFLTTKGGLTDNRHSTILKKLTNRGKKVLSTLIFMMFILIAQEINNKNLIYNKDIQLVNEQHDRDSLITTGIKSGVDSSTNRLFKDLSKAFADQNLKIDTLQKSLKIIKDSIKTSVSNFYSQNDPVLMIDSVGIKLRSTNDFLMKFTSIDAGSTNLKINSLLLFEFKDGSTYNNRHNFFPENVKLPKNGKWETTLKLETNKELIRFFINLKGTYTTLDGAKSYTINDVYVYDIANNKTSILTDIARNMFFERTKSL